jgi:hypothetical protein
MDHKDNNNSKKSTRKNNFYSAILNALTRTTNLTQIQLNLKISKQQLNYYLRQLKAKGLIIQKGNGWYEPNNSSKNSTNHGKNSPVDFVRGHAYVWEIQLPEKVSQSDKWKRRIEILESSGINYKLVGALKNTPRIKVLGRKVWLCNDKLRIYDIKSKSYYGETAVQANTQAGAEFFNVIDAIEHKLEITLRPLQFKVCKEHYALIKNALAIDHNRRGEILRISDDNGEWLLIDDSLGEGGELETQGKKSLVTNVQLQRWWNEQKETKFEVTPKFILNSFDTLIKDRQYWAEHQKSHVEAIQTLSSEVKRMSDEVTRLNSIISKLNN